MFANLSKDEEDMLYCFLLFVVVGWIIYKICQYNSNKVEQYINMSADGKGDMYMDPYHEVDESLPAEKANYPKRKERDFPPSLVGEGEIISQMNDSLADYKLLDEQVTVQPMIQQIDSQLSQPSPDAFSSMYAPINFESKLAGDINIDVDIDSLQGPPRKQVPESISGSKGGKTLNIIMVYAPWCGWSKKALPDFERLIRDYNGKTINGTLVQVIKYNSDVDTEMVEKYEVEGFPTFIMEKVTTTTSTEIINERDYEGLVSIIKKNA